MNKDKLCTTPKNTYFHVMCATQWPVSTVVVLKPNDMVLIFFLHNLHCYMLLCNPAPHTN